MHKYLFILVLFSYSVIGAPYIKTTINTYDVYLGNSVDLGQDLNAATPINTNGRKFHGYTRWDIAWKYRWKLNNGLCRIYKVSTNVDIAYTMPKAVTLPADQLLRERYEKYYSSLMVHEEGHGEFGVAAAAEIKKTILSMSYKGSCDKLAELANSKAHGILYKYKSLDDVYDENTLHGKTQGAFLN
jgi:predicted secreted Zn-dependent protease